jgi:acetyl esterase/lipase
MASLQAHLADALVRIQIKHRLTGRSDLATVRRVLGSAAMAPPRGVAFTPAALGDVGGEWAEKPGLVPGAPLLLYLHGGGYVSCSPITHRPITGTFAKSGFRVFAPDYRLAPEHPYPAAVDDARAVWHALLAEGHAARRIAVAGDSAGGGLALALMLALRDAGEPLPAAAALLSPWTDLAVTGNSVRTNAMRDAMFWSPGITATARHYCGSQDPTTPGISPLYGNLAGLPPMIIHVGDREILLDDSRRLAERAQAAGVTASLRVWKVVPHVWQLAVATVPEAAESLREMVGFLNSHLEK